MRATNDKKKLPSAFIAAAMLLALPILAQAESTHIAAAQDLADLSLEELSQVTVTSVSRRAERLIDAPASIYVITAEDIRRSGATGITDVLRLAPNLFVGRGDTSQVVAGARGQYAGTSNKMLVLVDGRTIYTPLFSGVFWDAQFVVVEDIERVEVISGPAATLWGSNGVNGVINIITKSARETQGTLVSGWGGNFESGGVVQQGGALGSGGAYRAYAKYRQTDERELLSGQSARDESERMLAGFRADWGSGPSASMVEGEIYKGSIDNLGGDRPVKGGHLLGQWTRPLEGDSRLKLQAYYDRTQREHTGTFQETLDIVDVEGQYELRPAQGHMLVSGAGYRYARDDITNTPALGFDPELARQYWANVFVQDQWTITRTVDGVAGIKAERNPYTGVEWLPNLRFSWRAADEHLVWGEVSRAIRAPSRIDRDAFTPVLQMNDTFDSEVANVAELGYRAQLTPEASLSLTAFYNHYPNLRALSLTPDLRHVIATNGYEGHSHGLEGWGSWRIAPWWRLTGGFTLLSERFELRPGYNDVGGLSQVANDPRHTWLVRSSWDVGRSWEIDAIVRNVGHIPNFEVPEYTVVDARIGWRPARSLELSVAVQNAFDKRYTEFGPTVQRALFGRTWLAKVQWQP